MSTKAIITIIDDTGEHPTVRLLQCYDGYLIDGGRDLWELLIVPGVSLATPRAVADTLLASTASLSALYREEVDPDRSLDRFSWSFAYTVRLRRNAPPIITFAKFREPDVYRQLTAERLNEDLRWYNSQVPDEDKAPLLVEGYPGDKPAFALPGKAKRKIKPSKAG